MSTEIKCECLDSLCDVLHKFGNLMAADHELLLSSLLSMLNSNQATVHDEDASWKLHRASAKCLAALIVSRPKLLSKLFKGKEENVKMDVFNLFIELEMSQKGRLTQMKRGKWLLFFLQELSKTVKSINRLLREKSIKTKVGVFSVLKELVVVLPNCLADKIGSLIPGIEKALNDKSSNSNLKIEALIFTSLVLSSNSPDVFHPYIKALSAPVLSAVGDRYYKVAAEALRVRGELVSAARPNIEGSGFYFRPYIRGTPKMVKYPYRAFPVIATSPLRVDLSCVLEHVVAELTAFLRKAHRALRQATLGTLNSLIGAYCDKFGLSAYEVIVVELSGLISDSDLHMTGLAWNYAHTNKGRESLFAAGVAACMRQAFSIVRWHC
ncbi:cullin-associated NEDD8-dissociated protein [Trifolium repens]|nr:cullin-associated NEDD8-dissociated protein [Trifolium repens]